jgi:hypothetical protein
MGAADTVQQPKQLQVISRLPGVSRNRIEQNTSVNGEVDLRA